MNKEVFELRPYLVSKNVTGVGVSFQWQGRSLILKYLTKGNIKFPAKSLVPQKKNGLWKSTCFELFLSPQGKENYFEWNFAPSGDWNFYSFKSYRNPIDPLHFPCPPQITTSTDNLSLKTNIEMKVPFLDECPVWQVGLTAVIESNEGEKTYWALEHLSDKPDFHVIKSFSFDFSSNKT